MNERREAPCGTSLLLACRCSEREAELREMLTAAVGPIASGERSFGHLGLPLLRWTGGEPPPRTDESRPDGIIASLEPTDGLTRLQEWRQLSEGLGALPWLILADARNSCLHHLTWALPPGSHRGRLLLLRPYGPEELGAALMALRRVARHPMEVEEAASLGTPDAMVERVDRLPPAGDRLREELDRLGAFLEALPDRLMAPRPVAVNDSSPRGTSARRSPPAASLQRERAC